MLMIGTAFAFASLLVSIQTAQIKNLVKRTPGCSKADNALWLENPLSNSSSPPAKWSSRKSKHQPRLR